MTLFFAWVYFTFLSGLLVLGANVAPPSPVRETLSGLGAGLWVPLGFCLAAGAWLLVRYRRDADDWIFRSRGANLVAACLCVLTTVLVVRIIGG